MNIDVGDVVTLKSGGQLMTVKWKNALSMVITIGVIFFDTQGNIQEGIIPIACVEKVQP